MRKFKGNLPYIPNEIMSDVVSKYLTIYENYQILFVYKNLYIDWSYLQARDFQWSGFRLSKYNAIHLDNGNLYNKSEFPYDLITKTTAMSSHRLSNKDIETVFPEKIKPNPYGKHKMRLYNIRTIKNLSASKHFGITNLALKKNKKIAANRKKRAGIVIDNIRFCEFM